MGKKHLWTKIDRPSIDYRYIGARGDEMFTSSKNNMLISLGVGGAKTSVQYMKYFSHKFKKNLL